MTRHGLAQLQCPEFVFALLLELLPHSLVERLPHFAGHDTHLQDLDQFALIFVKGSLIEIVKLVLQPLLLLFALLDHLEFGASLRAHAQLGAPLAQELAIDVRVEEDVDREDQEQALDVDTTLDVAAVVVLTTVFGSDNIVVVFDCHHPHDVVTKYQGEVNLAALPLGVLLVTRIVHASSSK